MATKKKQDKELEALQERIDELHSENNKLSKGKKKLQEEVHISCVVALCRKSFFKEFWLTKEKLRLLAILFIFFRSLFIRKIQTTTFSDMLLTLNYCVCCTQSSYM